MTEESRVGDWTLEQIDAAIAAAIEANRGWHSDVGPEDYIKPFLRSLGLDDLADAVGDSFKRRHLPARPRPESPRDHPCRVCRGEGAVGTGYNAMPCPRCEGSGEEPYA